MPKITKNDFFIAYKVPCIKPKIQGKTRSLSYELYHLHKLILKEKSATNKKRLCKIAHMIHKDRYHKSCCLIYVVQSIVNFCMGRGLIVSRTLHANIQKNCSSLKSTQPISEEQTKSCQTTESLDFNSNELSVKDFQEKFTKVISPLDAKKIEELANQKNGPFEIFQEILAGDKAGAKVEFIFKELDREQINALLKGIFENKIPSNLVFIASLIGINSMSVETDRLQHTLDICQLMITTKCIENYLDLGTYQDGKVNSKLTLAMDFFVRRLAKLIAQQKIPEEYLTMLSAKSPGRVMIALKPSSAFDFSSLDKEELEVLRDLREKHASWFKG